MTSTFTEEEEVFRCCLDVSQIRRDATSKYGSLVDLSMLITGMNRYHSFLAVSFICMNNPGILRKLMSVKFPGSQTYTPVADVATMVEVLNLLPGCVGKQTRQQMALDMCRLFAGNESTMTME